MAVEQQRGKAERLTSQLQRWRGQAALTTEDDTELQGWQLPPKAGREGPGGMVMESGWRPAAIESQRTGRDVAAFACVIPAPGK